MAGHLFYTVRSAVTPYWKGLNFVIWCHAGWGFDLKLQSDIRYFHPLSSDSQSIRLDKILVRVNNSSLIMLDNGQKKAEQSIYGQEKLSNHVIGCVNLCILFEIVTMN